MALQDNRYGTEYTCSRVYPPANLNQRENVEQIQLIQKNEGGETGNYKDLI